MRTAPLLDLMRAITPLLSSAVILATACSSDGAALDLSTAGTVSVGRKLSVTLQTIGPGSYGTPEISSDAVEFLEMTFPELQNPGGPMQVYEFRAAAPGPADVVIPHSVRAEPYEASVTVRK